MKIELLPKAFCRTPAFSMDHQLEESWPSLKEMIKLASPDFFKIIQDLSYDELIAGDYKVKFSVWKYFNRAKYRATPFASMASFFMSPVNDQNHRGLRFSSTQKLHSFTDWKTLSDQIDGKKLYCDSTYFISNTTLYYLGKEMRYLRLSGEQFEIATLENSQELSVLLEFCKTEKDKTAIEELMNSLFGLSIRETKATLTQLIDCQAILCDRQPNITGTDYFARTGNGGMDSQALYVLAERKLLSGVLPANGLHNLSDLLQLLATLMPRRNPDNLDKFMHAFKKKFEQRVIPLALAMDPEAGCGYGGPVHGKPNDTLGRVFEKEEAGTAGKPFKYNSAYAFLINSLLKGGPVKLEEFGPSRPNGEMRLPNTFSILCHFFNGQPVIESMGGCTANSLLGRFTIASNTVAQFCRDNAELEKDANPGVIFFDVAYQAEKAVDNVNRRQMVYSEELPLLTWPGVPEPLTFDDILITVRSEGVILFSKKHKCRIVPRIPSAYNYTRSALSVYRFLCDLQHQGIYTDLSFSLQAIFPGLDEYPRVLYKNIIVCPRSWMLPTSFYKEKVKNERAVETLMDWFSANEIKDAVKAGHGDQTLCFDPRSAEDVAMFLQFCSQQKKEPVYLTEALLSGEEDGTDEYGRPYITQFVLSYGHQAQIYDPCAALASQLHYQTLIRRHLPGREWLYFQIYCNEERSDEILRTIIAPVTRRSKKDWFFIRYNDPTPHLRIRIRTGPEHAGQVMSDMVSTLSDLVNNGTVSDLQVRIYEPETDRYGKQTMEQVEAFFGADSRFAIKVLYENPRPVTLHLTALQSMAALIANCFPLRDAQLSFASGMAERFTREFEFTTANFKEINRCFKGLNITGINTGRVPVSSGMPQMKLFKQILEATATEGKRIQLLADLIHMHINRLFNADQRKHEAMLYHFVCKLLKMPHSLLQQPAEQREKL